MNALVHPPLAASRSHDVATGLGRLHVVECGSGPRTLVLWPSIFTDHHIYEGVADRLGDRYRLVLIDGPGHGGSEGPLVPHSIGESADALATVMDAVGLKRAILGGTSWGGMVAAELALRHPERAEAVVLMNTPMTIDGRRPGLKARFIAFGARYLLKTKFFRDGVAETFFSAEVLRQNPTYAAAFHSMLERANPRTLSAAIRSVLLGGRPLIDRVGELKLPALVIAGKADAMYPLAIQKAAADRMPQGRLEPVDGKHISVVERPDNVARLIADFLERAAIS
jgi:pimeloyl-ACP methyl ester carboxylesterase